ncbi:helix-turn-helix domain-containing protein [Amycolatopsis rubida]|uniref:Helix-turn-helix domain-containing protein n=1 Tax=Amycolatopsis rubida TaxID=112413 RepID=A0A1I6BN61_9PSEU|nr:helix-turn-helix transcriptional regulator [Amycolatopsis rubida]SFQ82257.1 Helix-turn-helix domain-containing protein [Amycolatopsis rubida]
MSDHLAQVVGERIRFYRTAVRRTKAVVAGLAGITPDYLYQIERGQKVPTLAVLAELATVLHVDLAELLSAAPTPPRLRADSVAADALYRALVNPATPLPSPRGCDSVRRAVLDAWRTWQTSPRRYTALTAQLPVLIGETEAALHGADAAGSRAAHGSAADLYCLLRTVTKRVGRGDLSLLVADRAVRAAEEADDPVRLAGARWNLTQVLLADGQAEGAEAVAMHAVDDLRPFRANDNLDALALSGALLLIAAIAAVRNGDAWGARDLLRLATPLAEKTGERNTCWTAFGPTNVAMYAVSIELESGEAAEGLRLAERIEPQHSPSIERRVAFLLDQAKGYQQRRDYARSLRLLETAASEATEDMQFRPTAHKLLRTTIERGQRSVSAEASRLAGQVGLPF